MKQSSFSKKICSYNKIMGVLDYTNHIFLDEIKGFAFKKVSKYSKSKEIFEKFTEDFKLINELLKKNDILNASSILRTVYENLLYFIVTSYDHNIIVNLDSKPSDFRKIIESNYNILFSEYFEKEDFNAIYSYLCKLLHPSSMKELVSYLSKTKKYQRYMSNNIKFTMLIIEYMLLNFMNRKILEKNDLNDDLLNFCTYVNLVNINQYLEASDKTQRFTKKYLFFDTGNKYIIDSKNNLNKLYEELMPNKEFVEVSIKQLAKKIEDQIILTKYKDIII